MTTTPNLGKGDDERPLPIVEFPARRERRCVPCGGGYLELTHFGEAFQVNDLATFTGPCFTGLRKPRV